MKLIKYRMVKMKSIKGEFDYYPQWKFLFLPWSFYSDRFEHRLYFQTEKECENYIEWEKDKIISIKEFI